MTRPKVSLIKCSSYDTAEVQAAVRKAVDLLGGIEAFVKPGERVLIKPNLLTDARPEEGIDTHPEVVRAVIRLVKPVTKNIYCGDSPSVWGERQDVNRVYEVSGVKKVCLEEGVELVYFTTPKMFGTYPLTDWLTKCDRLISVPKFKTHGFALLTAGIKNLFGLVVGMHKIEVHRNGLRPEDLSKALVDIYELRKPDLTILDGVVAMEGEGPGSSGSLRSIDLVLASADALAVDMVLSSVMGISPCDIPTNREAFQRGLGQKDLASVEILGDDLKNFVVKDFKLPKTTYLTKMPKWLMGISKKILLMRPCVRHKRCQVCGLCQKICPVRAIRLENKRIRIDNKKCIMCLCCQEICPHNAIAIKKNIILQLLTFGRS